MDKNERLVALWEDRQAIRNLMGRYVRALLHKEEGSVTEAFWSSRDDVALGLSDGWYLGRESLKDYYGHFEKVTTLTDEIMKGLFPEKTESGRGFGYLELKALSTDVIEVAGDRETAKAMWNSAGQKAVFTAAGPVTYLTYGTFAADLVREDGLWKLWHLKYLEEISHPQGEKWWEEAKKRPEMTEFSTLSALTPRLPDIPQILFEGYDPQRELPMLPPLPEKYETFNETFTYGPVGEVWL